MRYHETSINVRFNEVDSYRVAWHGHYVAWMEVGRAGLARTFGLDADQLVSLGYLAPVVHLELKYRKPARYGQELHIRTTARRTEAATMEFVCRILDTDGSLCASGRTVHVLTDLNDTLQYRLPPVIAERLDRLMAYLEV